MECGTEVSMLYSKVQLHSLHVYAIPKEMQLRVGCQQGDRRGRHGTATGASDRTFLCEVCAEVPSRARICLLCARVASNTVEKYPETGPNRRDCMQR